MSTQPTELSVPRLILESQRVREEFHQNVAQLRTTLELTRTAVARPPWTESVESSRTAPAGNSESHLLDVLTPREIEVLRLIAEGKSSKEIASELGMAFRTAVCHRYRIFQKLKVHETASVVRLAVRAGLVRP